MRTCRPGKKWVLGRKRKKIAPEIGPEIGPAWKIGKKGEQLGFSGLSYFFPIFSAGPISGPISGAILFLLPETIFLQGRQIHKTVS